jgi:molybdopterin-synthase adenylyltransferase
VNKSQVSLAQSPVKFDRGIAFSRTLGLVTPEELDSLGQKTAAIAGLGGVGGSHLLTLTRLGIGGFHLAEFDTVGLENFNRQSSATLDTIGRKKLDVMVEQALQINPELRIQTWPEGVNASNVDAFLEGADVYADSVDFFAFEARTLLYTGCAKRGIPAVTAGPLGMGVALLNFLPGHMTFLEYFDWKETDSDMDKALKFLVGLAPALPHRHALVDHRFVDIRARKGPSTRMGIDLCSGFLGTEIMKILLKRGKVSPAPHSLHFDGYTEKFYSSNIWFGNRNPLQKIKIAITRRMLLGKKGE